VRIDQPGFVATRSIRVRAHAAFSRRGQRNGVRDTSASLEP